MGSGSQATVNQQQAAPKVQKGWLLRYTRKQWSRHWFVLNNGSLTYYRAPTAELCSFLDGVLDLSLIKHIEVPQQEEQLALNHRSINHHLHHQRANSNSSLINFNGSLANAHAQQHAEQYFKFSLKMWNGECHLLSAASSSERQLWLAAINSCNNYDDETASSDSSSSSQSSNISAKSADIGSPHHVGSNVASVSLQPAAQQQQQQQQQSVQAPSAKALVAPLCGAKSNLSSLAYQQQQEKEAEISIEQLSLKLRSVVRKRHDSDQERELEQTNQSNSSQPAPPNERPKSATSQANGQICLSSEKRQDQQQLEQVTRVGRTYSSSSSLDCEDNSLDSSLLGGSAQVSGAGELVTSPLETPPAGRQKKRVTFDLSNQNDVDSSSSLSAPSSTATSSSSSSSSEDEDDDGELEQEEASLSSVSASTSENEDGDEAEDDDDDGEQDDERSSELVPRNEVQVASESPTRQAAPELDEGERNTHSISKRLEMRRRLELSNHLRYPCKQKLPTATFEDEDSASELVRRMLEKRKLHLMNKDGASMKHNRDCDRRNNLTPVRVVDSEEGSAISPSNIETSPNLEQHQPDSLKIELQDKSAMTSDQNEPSSGQKQQLELGMRLKSVEQSAELLERRLNDSYLSYSRLELSYKRLQMELVESRELNIKNVAQLQAKVDQLTSELKLRELELIEAKRKLLKHEEDQQRQRQNSSPPMSRKNLTSNWLLRNYSNSMLGPASGNKLLMNLANNSQLLASKGAVSQMKINQKLLNQSKQMQQKLDRIELKVDKMGNSSKNLISFKPQAATETSSAPIFEQI